MYGFIKKYFYEDQLSVKKKQSDNVKKLMY